MLGLGFIDTIANGISSYVSKRQDAIKSKEDHKNKLETLANETQLEVAKGNATAKIELAKNGQIQDFNLDVMSMNDMKSSYKDEFLLAVFIVPLIMAFIPSLQVYALKGFDVVSKMPEWYRYFIIGMGVVIFGMRGLLKQLLQSKIIKG